MKYLVTARKYRPQTFSEVAGQEHITKTLRNAIVKGRIAQAYIFAGPRGVGKTTTARILAKSLNCQNQKDGEPCNECEMCQSFNSSQSLDIIEIDGASNRRIEEIRTLRESVKYAPTKGLYKVYIIDEVHMLTTESFNALLKTLEEPPSNTVFIFATTDVQKVPATILSRCQRYDFRRIELDTTKSVLSEIAQAEGISIDDRSLTLIAKKADGALRDAQSLFDQVLAFCGGETIDAENLAKMLNLIDEEVYFSLTDAILGKDFKAAFSITNEIYMNGWNYIDFLDGLLEHFRNLMAVKVTGNSDLVQSAEVYKEKYLQYLDKFSEGDILRVLNYLSQVSQEIKTSSNPRLRIEVFLSHIIGFEKSSTISELLDRLKSFKGVQTPIEESFAPSKTLDRAENTSTIAGAAIAVPTAPEPVIPPQKQAAAAPIITKTTVIDINFIRKSWKAFTDSTKDVLLKNILRSLLLKNLIGDSLAIEFQEKDDAKIVKENCERIENDLQTFFRHPLRLSFEAVEGSLQEDCSPIAEAIISKLNASELR